MSNVLKINNLVMEKELNSSKLSRLTNLSQSNLWKTLNGKVPMTFSKLMKIISKLGSEEEKIEVIRNFLKQTNKEADIRIAMYYLYLSGYTDLLGDLVDKEYKQMLTNNYKEISKVFLARQKDKLHSEKFFREIEMLRAQVNLKQSGISVLISILSSYSFFDMGAYNILSVSDRMIQEKISSMSKGLERNLITIESKIICAYAHLMQDEPDVSKEILKDVLKKEEAPSLLKATGLSIMGESYIFTDPQEAIHYFELSLVELKKIKNNKSLIKRTLVENTIAFCCIIHNIPVKLECVHHDAEKALWHILRGNRGAACEILQSISSRSSMQDFYLSIAMQDKELRQKAYHRFLKDGNLFYIKIFEILK